MKSVGDEKRPNLSRTISKNEIRLNGESETVNSTIRRSLMMTKLMLIIFDKDDESAEDDEDDDEGRELA